MNDNSALIALFGAIMAGTFTTAGLMLRTAAKRDTRAAEAAEADRKERQELTNAIKILSKSHEAQADATTDLVLETRKGNQEAKVRNGHLGDQNIKLAELVDSVGNNVLEAVQHIQTQHIEKQTIDKQVIKK